MTIGNVGRNSALTQIAAQLLEPASARANNSGSQFTAPRKDQPLSVKSAAGSVSSETLAKIQELTQGGERSNGWVTFVREDGKKVTLAEDAYNFLRDAQPKNLDEIKSSFIQTKLKELPQLVQQANDEGDTVRAQRLTDQLESVERSVQNGTLNVELLDPQVPSKIVSPTVIRDGQSNIVGMSAGNVDLDWVSFQQVYGNGTNSLGVDGYDQNLEVGVNFSVGAYVVTWEK